MDNFAFMFTWHCLYVGCIFIVLEVVCLCVCRLYCHWFRDPFCLHHHLGNEDSKIFRMSAVKSTYTECHHPWIRSTLVLNHHERLKSSLICILFERSLYFRYWSSLGGKKLIYIKTACSEIFATLWNTSTIR